MKNVLLNYCPSYQGRNISFCNFTVCYPRFAWQFNIHYNFFCTVSDASSGHDLDLIAVGLWQQLRLLRLSREEELGTLLARDFRVHLEGGAYNSMGPTATFLVGNFVMMVSAAEQTSAGDDDGPRDEVVAVVAGHPVRAHDLGCRLAADIYRVEPKRADIVISSAGGYCSVAENVPRWSW